MGHDEPGDDERTLEHVQTLALRYHSSTGQCRVSPTDAIRAAGLDDATAVRYAPEAVDTIGVVPGFGVAEDDSTDRRGYTISRRGESGRTFQLEVPNPVLEALHLDTDSRERWRDDPPLFDVYAGEGVIAFERAASLRLPGDVLSTATGRKARELTLETTQTTTPRAHGRAPIAAITPAFNRAGGDFEAVEFLPDLATELDGVVPAVAREDTASGDTTRSVYRQGPDNHGAAVSLPRGVLAALGLSTGDFESVPRSACPSLVVYAGDGAIGFGRRGRRTVTLG